MKLLPAPLVFALLVGPSLFGVSNAEASVIRTIATRQVFTTGSVIWTAAAVSDDSSVASVTAELASDAGEETLPLVESDAWLHGAATLTALPRTEADVTVTVYDTASAALLTFSGTMGTDGAISLTVEADTCTSRSGCTDSGGPDIEVLAAEIFPAAKGYDLGLDLAGVDTYDVAYASVTVTEAGESVCVATDEKGNCLKWTSTAGASTRAEVYWDEVGSIWEGAATLAHDGVLDVEVVARDARGKKLETAKTDVTPPWLDGGEGVNVLGVDEDPLTGVGLVRNYDRCGWTRHCKATWALAVSSDGWAVGDDLPVDAQVELTNGKTITIPVNSYQRRGLHLCFENELRAGLVDPGSRLTIRGGSVVLADQSVSTLTDSPVCVSGGCFLLVEDDDGGYGLAVTSYDADASRLVDGWDLDLTITTEAGESWSATDSLTFDDEITAVFGQEVSLAGDPVGLDLSGKVSLLGAANKKGKQSTLAKGKFYGSFARNPDGELALAGADKDEVVSAGSVVTAGDWMTVELTTDTNQDGRLARPPLTVRPRGIDKEALRRGMVVTR